MSDDLPDRRHQRLVLPIAERHVAQIHAVFPMPEPEWAQMMRVLEAMKPGLTYQESDADAE